MSRIGHYWRALITALRMTARGETPLALEDRSYPRLSAWCRQTVSLIDALALTADQRGLDAAGRQTLMLHIEGRDVSLALMLAAVRHHAAEEFPHLLRSREPHAVLAIQAANHNDRFLLLRFSESDRLPAEVSAALAQIEQHLGSIPDEKRISEE